MPKNFLKFIAVVVLAASPTAVFASVNEIFKGWGWNGGGQVSLYAGNSGWISANCVNSISDPTCTGPGENNYGVDVDSAKNVVGWAWSTTLGWVCFGSTCPGDPPGAPSTSWATYDDSVTPPQLRGWARIYSLYTAAPSGQQGWISLNCTNSAVCGTSNYYVDIDLATGNLSGYAWSSTSNGGSYSGGIGWVRFDPQYSGQYAPTTVVRGIVPWLQAKYGDIYSKGNISTPSPFTSLFQKQNATFCIDKSPTATILNFTQGTCGSGGSGSLNTNINFPKGGSGGSNYTTTLGRINLTDIESGKFGQYVTITDLTSSNLPNLLNGKIYNYVESTGTNSLAARTFNNGNGAQNGSGLLIVRGNLNITGDILYQNSSITKLTQLASFGIMVLDDGTGTKGNVTIDPLVQTISANIYAEGTVSTGTTGSMLTDVPLVINGLLMAKKINFQRLYIGSALQPAEQIVYDGRIVANTPPGMNDAALALPKVFEGAPQ